MGINTKFIKRHSGTDHATALRGLAAISVVFIHYDGFGTRDLFQSFPLLDKLWNFTINLGMYGPTIFFIASGFALSASLSKARIGLFYFSLRRFCRLFPLLFLVMIFHLIMQYLFSEYRYLSLTNFFLKICFLDLFFPDYFYDDPIGVLATLPIEFWWSLSMPLLFVFVRRFGVIAEVLSGIATLYLNLFFEISFNQIGYINEYYANAFWKFGLCFYFGYLSFRVRIKFPQLIKTRWFVICILPIMLGIELVPFDFILNIYVFAILYLVMVDYKLISMKLRLLSDVMLFFGTVCYSVYLLHSPIRYTVASFISEPISIYLTSLALVLVVCPLTYILIERPGILWGERLISRLRD